VEREGETHHGNRVGVGCSAAGDTRTRGPPTYNERQIVQLACDQMIDHRRPRCIELTRGCGSTPARDPVGLLDERDAYSHGVCDERHRGEVFRQHPATGSVTEDERCPRLICAVQVSVRGSERRVDLERLHRHDGATPVNPGGAAP
jgi:hypothetical protein